MIRNAARALIALIVLTVADRTALSPRDHRRRPGDDGGQGGRVARPRGGSDRRKLLDRPALGGRGVVPRSPLRRGLRRFRRRRARTLGPRRRSSRISSASASTRSSRSKVPTTRISRLRPSPSTSLTASASGLDPHISVAAAELQAPRIASVRGLSLEDVTSLIDRQTEGRTLGLFGQPRVNVLELNLALQRLAG